MLERMRRSALAGGLTDQAVVSAGNFALNLLLARSFSEYDYGAFSLILSFVLFLNTLHQAFVIYPLSVEAGAGESRFGFLLVIAAALTGLEMLIFFPVMAGVAASARQNLLLLPACIFLFAWQLQDVWRRGLIARSRYGAALLSDVVRYGLPLLALLILARWSVLSLAWIFPLLAAASLVAAQPLLARVFAQRASLRAGLAREAGVHWRMGAPVIGANMLAALSTQWFLWLLAWSHDLTRSAALVALANIVAFSNPVIYGMENILVPEIARQRDNMNFAGLMTVLRRRSLAAFLLVMPLFAAVLIWPGAVLHLFYGAHKSYGQYESALRMLAGAYAATLAASILSATLRGYRASGAVFKMQLYPALLGVTLGSWLTLRLGVPGACLATLSASLLRAGIGGYYVYGLRGRTQRARGPGLTARTADIGQSA